MDEGPAALLSYQPLMLTLNPCPAQCQPWREVLEWTGCLYAESAQRVGHNVLSQQVLQVELSLKTNPGFTLHSPSEWQPVAAAALVFATVCDKTTSLCVNMEFVYMFGHFWKPCFGCKHS